MVTESGNLLWLLLLSIFHCSQINPLFFRTSHKDEHSVCVRRCIERINQSTKLGTVYLIGIRYRFNGTSANISQMIVTILINIRVFDQKPIRYEIIKNHSHLVVNSLHANNLTLPLFRIRNKPRLLFRTRLMLYGLQSIIKLSMYLAPSRLPNLMVPAICSLFLTRIRNVQIRDYFYAGYWERIRHAHPKKNLYLFTYSLQTETYLLSLVWVLTILCPRIRYRTKVNCLKSINKHLRYLSPSKLNIPFETITHYVFFFR